MRALLYNQVTSIFASFAGFRFPQLGHDLGV
jgi:hypothetical protein